MSDATSVVLIMPKSDADIAFLEMIFRHEELTGAAMPIDSLIILSRLRYERRLTTLDLTANIQKSEQSTRNALEKLVEAGLVDAHGTGRGRTYTPAQTCIGIPAGKQPISGRQALIPSSRSRWC